MRRPHLSPGAWLFCGIVTAALVAPAGVYAAVNSKVAIGDVGDTNTATVTSQHQLLTTMVAPSNVFHYSSAIGGTGCTKFYTPPAGKALVLTNVTMETGTGTAGSLSRAFLTKPGCTVSWYDIFETTQPFDAMQHTYPAGLPVDSLTVNHFNSIAFTVDGYLIPASQLPPSLSSANKSSKHFMQHR